MPAVTSPSLSPSSQLLPRPGTTCGLLPTDYCTTWPPPPFTASRSSPHVTRAPGAPARSPRPGCRRLPTSPGSQLRLSTGWAVLEPSASPPPASTRPSEAFTGRSLAEAPSTGGGPWQAGTSCTVVARPATHHRPPHYHGHMHHLGAGPVTPTIASASPSRLKRESREISSPLDARWRLVAFTR